MKLRLALIVVVAGSLHACGSPPDDPPDMAGTRPEELPRLRLVRSEVAFEDPPDEIRALAVVGEVLVAASVGSFDGWDAATGRRLFTVPVEEGEATAVAAVPGTDAFVGGISGDRIRLELRDAATGRPKSEIGRQAATRPLTNQSTLGPTSLVTALAVDTSGRRLVSCGNPFLTIWSLDPPGRVAGPADRVAALDVAFSSDGRTVVSGFYRTKELVWWDLGGNPVRTAKTRRGFARVAARGGLVAGVSVGGHVCLHDFRSGEPLRQLAPLVGHANDVAFDPTGTRVLAVGDRGFLRVWNAATGRLVEEIACGFRPGTLAVDGDRVHVAGEGLATFVFRTPERLRRVVSAPEPDGAEVERIAVVDGTLLGAAGSEILARNLDTGDRRFTAKAVTGRILALTALPGGDRFASMDGVAGAFEVVVRDSRTGAPLRRLGRKIAPGPMTGAPIGGAYPGPLGALLVDPAGEHLVAAGFPTLAVWSLPDLEPLAGPVRGAALPCAVLSADGRSLLAGGRKSRRMFRYDLDGRALPGVKTSRPVVRLAASGDRAAALLESGEVLVLDRATGTVVRELAGTVGSRGDLAFSSDGASLLAAGGDGIFLAWDVGTGEPLHRADLGFRARAMVVVGERVIVTGDGRAEFRLR